MLDEEFIRLLEEDLTAHQPVHPDHDNIMHRARRVSEEMRLPPSERCWPTLEAEMSETPATASGSGLQQHSVQAQSIDGLTLEQIQKVGHSNYEILSPAQKEYYLNYLLD